MKKIIERPVISEKSAVAIENGQYVFYVKPGVNKTEIRQFVESYFGVKVKKVATLKNAGKQRRRGRVVGKTADRRKAIVTLEEGQVIEPIKGIF